MAYKKETQENSDIVVRKESERTQRKTRNPFGTARQKLEVNGTIPGYHLHWINDTPGRIFQAEDGGYEFIESGDLSLSYNNVVSRNRDEGTRIKCLVGVNEDGSPMFAYLMKLKQEWYDEDQRLSQAGIDTVDKSIRGGKIEKIDEVYIPRSGISMGTK